MVQYIFEEIIMVHLEFPEYDVREDGSIWRNNDRYVRWGSNTPISPQTSNGYHQVKLVSRDGSRCGVLVHRLVASVYHNMDLHDLSLEPDHRDKDRSNNHKDNLEVVTRPENMRRAKGRSPWSVTSTHKECCRCGIMKPHNEFNSNSRSADGMGSRCRPCNKEYRESTDKGMK